MAQQAREYRPAATAKEYEEQFITWARSLSNKTWCQLVAWWRHRAEQTGNATFPPLPTECAEALGVTVEGILADMAQANAEGQ